MHRPRQRGAARRTRSIVSRLRSQATLACMAHIRVHQREQGTVLRPLRGAVRGVALLNSRGREAASARVGGGGHAPEYDVHALQDLPEDDMPAVEPATWGRREEELATVGVRTRIGHAQHLDGREAPRLFGLRYCISRYLR